jgi:hypothetical protein
LFQKFTIRYLWSLLYHHIIYHLKLPGSVKQCTYQHIWRINQTNCLNIKSFSFNIKLFCLNIFEESSILESWKKDNLAFLSEHPMLLSKSRKYAANLEWVMRNKLRNNIISSGNMNNFLYLASLLLYKVICLTLPLSPCNE